MNFYDRWLGLWGDSENERARSRKVIHLSELDWVQTPQDAKVALMVSRETGFRTWGSETLRAEIPVGWHTGKHKHGEETIHIVEGTGFSTVDGLRYDWNKGSTLAIPFGATHQHFNTGDTPAVYVSAMSVALEHFVGLHRTLQHEDAGATAQLPDIETSKNGIGVDGHRIVLLQDDAHVLHEELGGVGPEVNPGGEPITLGTTEGMAKYQASHHLETRQIMSLRETRNDFQVFEQEMSDILIDGPRYKSGKHAHMEATLLVLDGEGYSVIDEEKVSWSKGSSIHIVGPQTPHQHFNQGTKPTRMLRMAAGIRYFFERTAKREFPYLYFETRSSLD
jgi:gentisate 1,2-dioxygenase